MNFRSIAPSLGFIALRHVRLVGDDEERLFKPATSLSQAEVLYSVAQTVRR